LDCPPLEATGSVELGARMTEPFVVLSSSISGAASGGVTVLLAASGAIASANLILGADAATLAARMGDQPNDDELDGAGEVANQLFGQLKTLLREQHGVEVDVGVHQAAFYDPAQADFEWDPIFEEESVVGTAGSVSLADVGTFALVVAFSESLFAGAEPGEEPFAVGETRDVAGIERILDITLPLSVVVAQREMKIEEVLGFAPGTVLPFEKSSDSLLDLLVNEKVLAQGEAVRVGERFGLRIAAIGPVEDTIKMLGQ